ncbi:hypothetical protein EDD86DRAFT_15602 [Gorgonomyces haynaldii]|nr:hypothetical protein EDD86DRAFT_15602 [Gorgonomyces haynaldii]
MHHANLGCPCADSQIISSTVPLSVEKVDFGKYIYAGAECVLTYYPHILAQEGQFRFVYLFRFRKSTLAVADDTMTYDMCRNDYDMGRGRLPAWQGCDAEYPMRHNGVVLPPDDNPPPPPAHNCPVNGHWSEADGKCICNDGYHEDNGQRSKDVPPPPLPPDNPLPVPVPLPTVPIILPPVGPPQFPPKKTVPVKPPPTNSPDPSNTPPPTQTTPSDPDPTSTTTSTTSTSTNSCSLDTNNVMEGDDPRRRFCACAGLDTGIADTLFLKYYSGDHSLDGIPRKYFGSAYVDQLVVNTCFAAKFAALSIQEDLNDPEKLKLRYGVVSSVLSGMVGSTLVSTQGFSAKYEGVIPDGDNPAQCARGSDRNDPEQPFSDIQKGDWRSASNAALFARQATIEGQCGEPHAYKRFLDFIGRGTPHTVLSTVAVMVIKQTKAKTFIKTVPRCGICQNYRLFGDTPTDDNGGIIVYTVVRDADMAFSEPRMPHGPYTVVSTPVPSPTMK